MTDVLMLLLIIVIPTIIILIFHYNKLSLFIPNMFNVTFWIFILFAYVGLIPIYFQLDDYRVAIGLSDELIIVKLITYTIIATVVLSISYFIMSNIILKKKSFYDNTMKNTNISSIPMIVFTIICILVFIVYISQLNTIPIFSELAGDSREIVRYHRSQATNAFAGNAHYYTMFLESGLIMSSCYFLGKSLTSKHNFWKLMFLLVFVLNAFYSVHTTEKAPIIWYIISVFVTFLIVKEVRLKFSHLVSFSAIALTLLFLFYKNFMNMDNRSNIEILGAIFSRTFSGQLTPAYYYVELIPNTIPFLNGISFPNPGGLLPFDNISLPKEIYQMKFASFNDEGIVGSAPAPFWGEAFANFGILGIVSASIYIALLILVLELLFVHLNKNIITISIYVALIMQIKNIALTGIGNYLFNLNIIFIFIVGISLILFSYKKTTNTTELL